VVKIGLIGDYNAEVVAHQAIPQALKLAANDLGVVAEPEWIPTPTLDQDAERKLAEYQAIWTVPASPYASMQGALNGIRYARERRIPFLGTCGGFQHMVIEFARNVVGLAEAEHAEENPEASLLLVTPLTCSVSTQVHTFKLSEGSRVREIYGTPETAEQYGICSYGPNTEYRPMLERAGLRVAGVDEDGNVRIMELEGHPFFVGTLFQPERSALENKVHPLIRAFLRQAVQA